MAFSGIPRPTAPPTNIVEQLEQDELGRFTTLLDLVAPTAPAGASAAEVAADKAVTEANAGLVELLTGTGPVTIFAPTNTAFAALGVTEAQLKANPAALNAILSLHVVEKDVSFSEPPYVTDGLVDGRTKPEDAGLVIVSAASTLPSVAGPNLLLSGTTKQVWVEDDSRRVSVVEPDLQAPNGFVQIVDKVLLPPGTVVGGAAAATTTPRT